MLNLPRGNLTWVFFLATIVRWLGFLDTDGVFFLGAIWLVMTKIKIKMEQKSVYLPNEKIWDHDKNHTKWQSDIMLPV
jgi:hypothetical protein